MMDRIFRIAIDGPSGAGKSTIAKAVASRLGIDYIDTGAMYRAVGYKMDRDRVPFESGDALNAMLADTDIDFVSGDIILDGQVVNDLIRTPEVSMLASQCSQIPEVREKLVEIQRGMGERKSVIMDGRDIGTVVFPDAELKIFVTASTAIRAQRRYDELRAKGEACDYEEILHNVEERDRIDSTREISPLRQAPDAIVLDNSHLTIEEQKLWLLEQYKRVASEE